MDVVVQVYKLKGMLRNGCYVAEVGLEGAAAPVTGFYEQERIRKPRFGPKPY